MTREELFFKYACECKDTSCLPATKKKCSAEFYRDLDSVIENEKQSKKLPEKASSDFKATLNPNPNWEAENQFIESIEKDKVNLTQEELDRRVEDFVLEYGLFGFKTAERLKVVLKEVEQNENINKKEAK